MKTKSQRNICTPIFTAALLTIPKIWKQQMKCPSIDEWIKKLWYMYTMEYYSATTKRRSCHLRAGFCVLVTQWCPTLYDPMDYISPGSSVHGNLQARLLEWVAISFSRASSRPRAQTWVSFIAGRFFTVWAIREAPEGMMLSEINVAEKEKNCMISFTCIILKS